MPLIICPECNSKISDKAAMCVHCGCPREFFNSEPNNAVTTIQKAVKKPVKRTRMKMPNGYGHIKHLSGNRRKPYAAYPPRRKTDYDDNGKELPIKALGYFKTRAQAETCLMEYRSKYGDSKTSGYTYKDIFEKFIEDYKSKPNVSEASIRAYTQGFNKTKELHDMPIYSIKKDEMQKVIDNCNLSYASLLNIKLTYNAIFKHMISNGLATVNYASFVEIKKNDDRKSGTPLTIDELKIYWEHRDEPVFQIAWILILTGFRINELKVTKIDLEDKVFIGGLKTKQGKERIVPIHPLIFDYVKNFNQKDFNSNKWRTYVLYPALKELKIDTAPDNEKRTPHDFRHTFSWLCDKFNVEEISKYMIIGHDLGKDVDKKTYTHRTVDELRNEIEKINIKSLLEVD